MTENRSVTELYAQVPKTAVYEGASFTGKTAALMEAIREALGAGMAPEDMAVFCATPVAAQELRRRLTAEGNDIAGVDVLTPREYFLRMLQSPEAVAYTGRKARLLLPFEYDFFLEDLKTSGIRPGRLKEILKFFYKGFDDLETEDPDWLITNEERELMASINDSLSFVGAMLEAEVAPFAASFLRSEAAAAEPWRKHAVFADDYNLYSRATQVALSLLARESLTVASNPFITYSVFETHPNVDGARELMERNPNARVELLKESRSCRAAGKAAQVFYEELDKPYASLDGCGGAAEVAVYAEEFAGDEAQACAEAVRRALDGAKPSQVVVACQSAPWRLRIMRALGDAGIETGILPNAGFLRCDVRKFAGSGNARFVTLLSLAADPTDGVAWRAAIGFGDYLTNSNGVRSLRNSAMAGGAALAEVLAGGDLQPDILDGLDALASVNRIDNAYHAVTAILEKFKGLSGTALISAIAEAVRGGIVENGSGAETMADYKVPGALIALCVEESADNSAAAMVERLRRKLAFAQFASDDTVRVVSYENTTGLAPSLLLLAGFMNGFFPKSDYFDRTVLTFERAERRHVEDLNCMAGLVARATEELAVSYCDKMPLEDAERQSVVIDHIVFEDGQRIAIPEVSIFAEQLGIASVDGD